MKEPKATLSGTVLDAAGKPVAGARVYLAEAPGPTPDIAMLTGADGRFTLAAAQPGRYRVACSTDALGTASAAVEVGAGDPGDARVELRLGRRAP